MAVLGVLAGGRARHVRAHPLHRAVPGRGACPLPGRELEHRDRRSAAARAHPGGARERRPARRGAPRGLRGRLRRRVLSTAIVVGALREAESSARLRARALSRRTIDTESGMRRRLAEAIHDGPLQELSSAEMMLASAEQALDRGDERQGREALSEARALTRANVCVPARRDRRSRPARLRGALASGRRSATASSCGSAATASRCSRRSTTKASRPRSAGPLFRITQEAVANAGKHAAASTITIRLRRDGRSAALEVEDDGRGFGDVDPLGAGRAGPHRARQHARAGRDARRRASYRQQRQRDARPRPRPGLSRRPARA